MIEDKTVVNQGWTLGLGVNRFLYKFRSIDQQALFIWTLKRYNAIKIMYLDNLKNLDNIYAQETFILCT